MGFRVYAGLGFRVKVSPRDPNTLNIGVHCKLLIGLRLPCTPSLKGYRGLSVCIGDKKTRLP